MVWFWVATKLASYAVVPVATYVGTTIGTHIGLGLCGRLWRASSDYLWGLCTFTVKRSRTYVVSKGKLIEVDVRKKYVIERGELVIYDGYELGVIKANTPSTVTDDWVKIEA